jgi:hypothetical protein
VVDLLIEMMMMIEMMIEMMIMLIVNVTMIVIIVIMMIFTDSTYLPSGNRYQQKQTKIFVLTFINRLDFPFTFINRPNVTFFRFILFLKLKFLPNHSFEIMTTRLCAMDMNPPPACSETAYPATGDHHLFLLIVNAILAATIQGGFRDKLEFQRYDASAAVIPSRCSASSML